MPEVPPEDTGSGPAVASTAGLDSVPRPANHLRRMMRLYESISGRFAITIAIVAFVLVLGAWWVAAEVNLAKDIFLPGPVDVWANFKNGLSDGTLWTDTKASFLRITIGFAISTGLALPLGILIGTYRIAEAAIGPLVDFVRYMPAVAFLPLTIVWIGVGESQKWMIIFIGTFFQQILLINDNVKRVPRGYIDVGRTLGISELTMLRRVVIPSSAPEIWDTLRITLGWAWTWLVVAELVAAPDGLGHRIILAQRYFQTDTIFVGILIIGLLGLVMDQSMKYLGKRMFRWENGSL